MNQFEKEVEKINKIILKKKLKKAKKNRNPKVKKQNLNKSIYFFYYFFNYQNYSIPDNNFDKSVDIFDLYMWWLFLVNKILENENTNIL